MTGCYPGAITWFWLMPKDPFANECEMINFAWWSSSCETVISAALPVEQLRGMTIDLMCFGSATTRLPGNELLGRLVDEHTATLERLGFMP